MKMRAAIVQARQPGRAGPHRGLGDAALEQGVQIAELKAQASIKEAKGVAEATLVDSLLGVTLRNQVQVGQLLKENGGSRPQATQSTG